MWCPMALNIHHARGEAKVPLLSYTTIMESWLIPSSRARVLKRCSEGIMCGKGESGSQNSLS
ncbi:Uncharacterised protein [Vibrio cholerae]|nr:Uncharacterised protein [Vibrio cholerae]